MIRNFLNEGFLFLIRLEVESARRRSGLITFHRLVSSFSEHSLLFR